MGRLPHADIVGSLIRPQWLLDAREELAAGRIAPADFKRIEDAAVNAALAAQEQAGLGIVTDGEMRRLSFQSQLPEAVEGFGEFDLDAFLWGDWRGGADAGDLRVERRRRSASWDGSAPGAASPPRSSRTCEAAPTAW